MRLARPRSGLLASFLLRSESMSVSIWFSISSDSLYPSGPNSLMPLSSKGLWEAEIITPRSQRIERVSMAIAGVGIGPVWNTSMPTEVKPATNAVTMLAAAKHDARCLTDPQCELGGNHAVGTAPDAIGAEISSRHSLPPPPH